MSAIAEKALTSDEPSGPVSFTAAYGAKRRLSFARIVVTPSRHTDRSNEAKVNAANKGEVRPYYRRVT